MTKLWEYLYLPFLFLHYCDWIWLSLFNNISSYLSLSLLVLILLLFLIVCINVLWFFWEEESFTSIVLKKSYFILCYFYFLSFEIYKEFANYFICLYILIMVSSSIFANKSSKLIFTSLILYRMNLKTTKLRKIITISPIISWFKSRITSEIISSVVNGILFIITSREFEFTIRNWGLLFFIASLIFCKKSISPVLWVDEIIVKSENYTV